MHDGATVRSDDPAVVFSFVGIASVQGTEAAVSLDVRFSGDAWSAECRRLPSGATAHAYGDADDPAADALRRLATILAPPDAVVT